MRKNFNFLVFTVLENALVVGIFPHSPHQLNYAPRCCHHTLGRGKLLILPTAEMDRENMICFIKINQKI